MAGVRFNDTPSGRFDSLNVSSQLPIALRHYLSCIHDITVTPYLVKEYGILTSFQPIKDSSIDYLKTVVPFLKDEMMHYVYCNILKTINRIIPKISGTLPKSVIGKYPEDVNNITCIKAHVIKLDSILNGISLGDRTDPNGYSQAYLYEIISAAIEKYLEDDVYCHDSFTKIIELTKLLTNVILLANINQLMISNTDDTVKVASTIRYLLEDKTVDKFAKEFDLVNSNAVAVYHEIKALGTIDPTLFFGLTSSKDILSLIPDCIADSKYEVYDDRDKLFIIMAYFIETGIFISK
jgi:hypothetical protein